MRTIVHRHKLILLIITNTAGNFSGSANIDDIGQP